MKKLTSIATLLTSVLATAIFSSYAIGNEIEAPKDILVSLTNVCTKTAAEEQIEPIEKQQFVSDCINAQLIEMGYQRQPTLAKTNETNDKL